MGVENPRGMRKFVLVLGAALLVGGLLAPAQAGPSAGGFSSDNIEYLETIPLHADTAGAALEGKYFYITTERDLTIYDVSDPLEPVRVGFLPLIPPGQFYFPEEDPETNGEVLLVGNGGGLDVIDVEDKTNPAVIGQVEGADEHTISCVLDCKWAYGSEGVIVNLTDPTTPKIAGNWQDVAKAKSTHDVTEVAPGIVLTSSQPMYLFDARKNPAKPKIMATMVTKDGRFIHSNLWPHAMKDKFILVGGETSGPACDDEGDGQFMTFDATKWRKNHTFEMIDEYRVTNGVPTEGNAAANLFCTHWFTTHPDYKNGGLVSMAWYEHGTRLFNITSKGQIEEAGYFVPHAGSTSATYWITDEILYAADYNRGLDILRYTGK